MQLLQKRRRGSELETVKSAFAGDCQENSSKYYRGVDTAHLYSVSANWHVQNRDASGNTGRFWMGATWIESLVHGQSNNQMNYWS